MTRLWNDIDWRSRRMWVGIGYFASAAWMLFVVVKTGGNAGHPLFDYIFIVPIGMWAVGLALAWMIRKIAGPQ